VLVVSDRLLSKTSCVQQRKSAEKCLKRILR